METIQPISPRPPEISVAAPVSAALERVKQVLFRPFDLGKWFVIGFCAWLAHLGENGGGFNFHTGSSHGSGGNFHHELERAKEFVLANLYWIVPVAAVVFIFCLALGLVITWLSSRGKFMFLHCVALNKAEVVEPWRKFKSEGNSLFWFRIVLGLAGSVIALPLVVLMFVPIIRMIDRHTVWAGAILLLIGIVLTLFLVCLVFAVITKLTTDFVVPIMYLRRCRCLEAWRELRGLLGANVGQFVLYLLFCIVLGLGIGMVVLMFMIATCCLCCLMLLPYISAVVLLPVLMFKRCYSLYYLAQYGPHYNVFPSAAGPSTTPPPGLAPVT